MPFNPYTLNRPKQTQETREFTDPLQPDAVLTLTLRSCPGYNDVLTIAEQSIKWQADYVDGRDGGPPAQLNVPGFGEVKVSAALCQQIARVAHMHVPSEETPVMDFGQWAVLAEAMPNAFGQIVRFSVELHDKESSGLKNAPKAGGDSSTVPPSTTTPQAILT